jgi:hypothetical protein
MRIVTWQSFGVARERGGRQCLDTIHVRLARERGMMHAFTGEAAYGRSR